MKNSYIKLLSVLALCGWTLLSGCTSVNTFPSIARPGDTVSLMIGGSEQANKSNISATFTDSGGQIWDLKALNMLRSVFNLRTDGRAYGLHYGPYSDTSISWAFGHEPVQTVLVADIPSAALPGSGYFTITLNGVSDNSGSGGGIGNNFQIGIQVISGVGATDNFAYRNVLTGIQNTDFSKLESSPNAKISFGTNTTPLIGAVSLVIDFDQTIVNPADLNVYVPESTVRGSYSSTGAFGSTQRMVYWRQDGSKLYADILSPQGIAPMYLQLFIVHPRGLTGSPAFSIVSSQVYDVTGSAIAVMPTLTYTP